MESGGLHLHLHLRLPLLLWVIGLPGVEARETEIASRVCCETPHCQHEMTLKHQERGWDDDIPRWGRNPSRSTGSLAILAGLSYMVGLWDRGDDEFGGELETATWFSRSVARRLVPGVANALRLAVDGVIEGSVALDRRSLGRLLLDLEESLLWTVPRRDSVGDAISSSESDT